MRVFGAVVLAESARMVAIVEPVVTRHRGEFLVESVPGRGSAFGVVLPGVAAVVGSVAGVKALA